MLISVPRRPPTQLTKGRLRRFVAPLQAAHIASEPHLFIENDKAPPESIAAAVESVAKQVDATMVVVARSNKASLLACIPRTSVPWQPQMQ